MLAGVAVRPDARVIAGQGPPSRRTGRGLGAPVRTSHRDPVIRSLPGPSGGAR